MSRKTVAQVIVDALVGVGVEAHLTGKRRPAVHPSDANVAARQWPS
jgi:NAD(P)H-hydrate repair Nnr-like enzyme with NAD(P)H-hydrate epimerase domain